MDRKHELYENLLKHMQARYAFTSILLKGSLDPKNILVVEGLEHINRMLNTEASYIADDYLEYTTEAEKAHG